MLRILLKSGRYYDADLNMTSKEFAARYLYEDSFLGITLRKPQAVLLDYGAGGSVAIPNGAIEAVEALA